MTASTRNNKKRKKRKGRKRSSSLIVFASVLCLVLTVGGIGLALLAAEQKKRGGRTLLCQ